MRAAGTLALEGRWFEKGGGGGVEGDVRRSQPLTPFAPAIADTSL